MDWLPRVSAASPTVQWLLVLFVALGSLAVLILVVYVGWLRRLVRTQDQAITALQTGRTQNAERIDGLTLAVERLARHHHIGASLGGEPYVDDDVPVIIEQTVDSSIPWINPVQGLHDHPELMRDADLPLERFADPAPVSDPNMPAVTAGGRQLPPVPPDPRRLRQYVAPARNITSEPITAVDTPAVVLPTGEPAHLPRHAAPATGRHAAH